MPDKPWEKTWYTHHDEAQHAVIAVTMCQAGCFEDLRIAIPEELAYQWLRSGEIPPGMSEETAEVLRSGMHPRCRLAVRTVPVDRPSQLSPPPLSAAWMEQQLLRDAHVRNFVATFDLLQPDGTTVPFELRMPAGRLRQEIGQELDPGFVDVDVMPVALASSFRRWLIRMNLSPEPAGAGEQATLRVVK